MSSASYCIFINKLPNFSLSFSLKQTPPLLTTSY